MTMELDRLIADLSNMPHVRIGHGPRHPFNPDSSLAPELDDYLGKHPFLLDYTDYVRFLECYGGASLNSPPEDPVVFFMIFGIGKYYEEGLIDQQQSFYCFCDAGTNGPTGLLSETEFLFDASGAREKAVYSRQVGIKHGNDGPVVRAYPGFLEWLAFAVAMKGVISKSGASGTF
jgi:hypothetical protein